MRREYPDRPIIGVGVVVLSEAGVLLIKRGKPPRIGSWSLPGGAQELGETVAAAAHREVLEETAVEIAPIGLVEVVDSITKDAEGRIQYHYTLIDLAASAEPSQPIPGGDAAGAEWVPLDQLAAKNLWSETLRVIGMAEGMWRAAGGDQRSRKPVDTEE